jgi:DNA modification methylase
MKHAKLPLEMPETKKDEGPVTCLGMTFENDQERREYFTEILRQKLPELKKIEGYPIGEDEDILALSDPPYYTACPNPFIKDFIKEWELVKQGRNGANDEIYQREPFVADVSEGKNDPIYRAHSYHTKVPPKAVMRYLLHYTKAGDIVFDGFAGTGMTGVAAQMCNNRSDVEALGYRVDKDGVVFDEEGIPISNLGYRKAILMELSPAASFISYNYNAAINKREFVQETENILAKAEDKLGWLYQTIHVVDGKIVTDTKNQPVSGKINYVIWSEVFLCPHCLQEIVFWEVAVDEIDKKIRSAFDCPSCSANLLKKDVERVFSTHTDKYTGCVVSVAKRVPVMINYSVGKRRFNKSLDQFDYEVLQRIEETHFRQWVPTNRLPIGDKTAEPIRLGIDFTHQMHTERALVAIASYHNEALANFVPGLWVATAVMEGSSLLNRERPFGLPSKLSGTLYISSLVREINVFDFIGRKILKHESRGGLGNAVLGCQSTDRLTSIPSESVDYMFLDPPFGANLMYSELNFVWESWLKVLTNNEQEAVVSRAQEKTIQDYQVILQGCFHEFFRILKPNRWITVEFSNSQASIWNAIQEVIQRSGFVIANVTALDKKQGSFNAVTSPTAVKQDLVISAYKPSDAMISEIRIKENTGESAWIFARNHLQQLPVFVGKKGEAELIVERTPRVLFDRMVAYHVQNGYSVPISSAEFQEGVAQRFPMRDGMAFLETQVTEYDKKRLLAKEFVQTTLFVSDENSAIEWLRQQLMQKPQTRQDLHPNFMKELQHISKHELLPELDVLLEQNFLMYDGTGLVPSQIHGYLSTDFKDLRNLDKEDPKLQAKAKNRWYVPDPNKQADLERLRERSLLREFNGYVEELGKSKKKLRQFRTEAIRAGFKTAWGNQDYQTIVDVGQRLPESILQEDSTMLMYYDNAQIRLGM